MTEQEELARLRQSIDQLDQQIQQLINERARCAQQVAEVKQKYAKAGETPVFYRPEREAQILRRVMKNNPGPVPDAVMAGLIREVMSVCLSLEQPLDVACVQSDHGHGHQAAARHFGQAARLHHYSSDQEALDALLAGSADYAVIDSASAFWSSLLETEFAESRLAFSICGEMVLPVEIHGDETEAVKPKLTGLLGAEGFNRLSDQANGLDQNLGERFWVIGKIGTEASGLDLTSLLLSWAEGVSSGRLEQLEELLESSSVEVSQLRLVRSQGDQAAGKEGLILDLVGHDSEAELAALVSSLTQAGFLLCKLGSYPVAAF